MMNTKVKLLLTIIWCHLLPVLSAQEMINVRHYSIEDGLSQNIVQDMLQDNDGYIWLATWNGLEKFDGYTFKNYKSYPTDDTKLKYNRLVSIVKGADDALWCHTYDDKVYLFDVRQEKFNDIFVYHPQIEECKLVEKMIPLTNGIMWIIASDGNLWCIDEALYKKDKGVMFLPSGSVPQHGNRVYSVVRDAHDNEWVLTDKGCFVYGKRELSDSRNFNNAKCIDHILYMSSPDGELVTYTPEEGIKEVSIKETDYGIIDLLELPNAKMGIMTNRGIIIYDTQNNHAESILVNENHPDIQPSYHLLSNNGILWMINGKENVIRCDLKQKSISFINYPLSQKEKANIFIHEDNYGRIWILAPNGEFSFYNPITNVFEQGYTYINGEHTYYHATGRKFLIDNQQNIWLSCDSGVDQLTFLNESYSYFSTGHNDKIRGLFVDSKQRIWVADKSERIEIYNDNHDYCGNLSRDGHLVKDKQLVFGADIYCFFEDEQHRIWMGSRTGGIYVAVPEAGKFRIYHFKHNEKDKNSLSSDAIFSICQDTKGNIWVGTDAGVYVYNPLLEDFTVFDRVSDTGDMISRAVTRIESDEDSDIWISVDYQGLFHFDRVQDRLINCLHRDKRKNQLANVTRFWFEEKLCWVSLYDDNLYYTKDNFKTLFPFQDSEGKEPFKDDIINTWIMGPHNCWYIGSSNGLTEINLTTGRVRRLLNYYVRDLGFKSDKELWVGTESGLYIYDLEKGEIAHLTVSNGNDSYALADNAIYSICRDNEGGMWIGSYFGGVNYYPRQWTYFEKFYPRDDIKNFGRRVREFCESNDGTVWIGTEDKGLFHFYPESGKIEKFSHPSIYQNVHGLCLDGDDLWVGTFSGGLSRIDLLTKQVRHYQKGISPNSLDANNVFSICKTTSGDLWIGTTSGLLRYNRDTDDFTRMPELANMFVYKILEDFNGNLWLATYSNGVFRYDVNKKEWKNFIFHKNDSTSLPYDKVISICEDSRKRLWFMTQGAGFCCFNPENESFTRFDMSKGFPSNIIYRMVEDNRGNLWLTTNNGLVCFNPETDDKRVYTTANGLLSNQFNYQSGYKDKMGRIYLGSINGFITFDPSTFVENTFVPPVVITDFFLFNKRMQIGSKDSPLKESIVFSDEVELESDQNSFSLHAAALGYQAPEMNQLVYKMEGFDKEWYNVGRNSVINYSNLPYGTYIFHLRGSNSDGKWNEKERILKIHILPPFYLSGWAYFIYLLLGILSVVGIIYYFRKRNEQKHQQAMEKFEREKERELYTAKIDFFTNVAHEIRTPLTLIKSPLENVLVSPNVSADIRDDLEIMNLNTTRLLDLVNQLLDFRKTETRGFQLNFVECNISDILQQIYMRFTPLARQKKLEFVIECSESIYASIDREALTKIISNLFTNAIKYSETYIHVRLWMEDTCWFLSVCNDGNVIPMEMREEIFKPFIQYKDGFSRKVSGTGIGLALARSLAELHEGNLIMDDSQKQNCFILSLPVKHEHTIAISKSEVKLKEDPKEEDPGQLQQKPRYTVLIVEDNVEMLAFVVRQLSPVYQILTATNGVEALKVLEGHTVNLIVSDIMMPEMDGLELCDRIKSDLDYSHIPIVLLTAKTTLQSKIDGLKSGADAYIEKPFSVEYLKVSVANLLSNHEKLHAAFAHSPFIQTNSMAMTKADETFLKTLNEVIVANMQNPDFCLDDMASLLNMSRSSLNRKIKGVLDMTPNDYIRLERLKKAAQLLREGECKVNEVCYMVGFNTPSYFTKCFQKQFGILPKDFVK